MERTVYVSSRTPLHDFKLPGPVWSTRKIFQCVKTSSKIKNKSTRVSKPCLRIKQSKKQTVSRPVNKACEVVRERSSVRRREGLFSMSLRKEEIHEDFIGVMGRLPHGKMNVKKIFNNDTEKHEHLGYLKYLKQLNPGNFLSEIYHV